MSCGVYKITNKLNNKVYIGCSKNIEHRWVAHKSESILQNHTQYNYAIHRAFRKYGINNFQFEIIEILEEDKIFEREQYWIKYYDSFHNGYNETIGGDSGPSWPGELNPNAKLNKEDIIFIRESILNDKMPSEIYPLFSNRITRRGFNHIWQGDSWKDIMPEAIDYVKSKAYQTKIKTFAAKSSINADKI